jgi:hypothetical protein
MPARLRNKVRGINDAMIYAANMESISGWPKCYFWRAVWWRLHSRESMNKSDPFKYSRNLVMLYNDIKFRRNHYIGKPKEKTDWEWSGLFNQKPNGGITGEQNAIL